ncbi:hypothetical protein CSZ94_26250 [Janthinobacterium sp. ROICE36]|uniref:hypothetical protein n=1 Tax=Janthinobacterium sp. ROICE36 TaxID=2048670 RepID=UPI000C7ECB5B|nr:hypothetical protein [Janthinobacterium sp. ROICE36]PLY39463.1 hypothetical protein CSZ94_26250 [Janthinobacterium sp. ROICE36]
MSIKGLDTSYSNAFPNVNSDKVSTLVQSETKETEQGSSAATAPSSIVTLSDKAKTASTQVATSPSFMEIGMAARTKLDVAKQQGAEKTGATVSSVNLNHVDYSAFSDQELAAMNLNSSGNFSKDEQIQAQGVLGERVRVSLETYRGATNDGDRRGHAMAIDALYTQMTPEMRSVLGWTPTMMNANDHMLAGDEKKFGKLSLAGILAHLETSKTEGGITFENLAR